MRTRSIVIGAVALVAVLLGGSLYVALGGDDDRRMGALTYTAARWLVEVDGEQSFAQRVEGCHLSAPVVRDEKGTPVEKRVGQPRWEPCKLTLGIGMSRALYGWIAGMLDGQAQAKNVVLLRADGSNKIVGGLDLQNALITEFSLPALDGASKDVAHLTVQITPGSVRYAKGGTYNPQSSQTQKSFIASNFRLTIPGLDTSRVSKIESWSTTVGEIGNPQLSNLKVTTGEIAAQSFADYLDLFVVQGQSTAVNEKTASIELLASDLTTVLLTVDFTGVGIFAGELYASEPPSSDAVARRRYEFYVERAKLTIPKA